ncbi:hypothetical protein D3C84_968940 [compost metagenome]
MLEGLTKTGVLILEPPVSYVRRVLLIAAPCEHFLLELLRRTVVVFAEHFVEVRHVRHPDPLSNLRYA